MLLVRKWLWLKNTFWEVVGYIQGAVPRPQLDTSDGLFCSAKINKTKPLLFPQGNESPRDLSRWVNC